MKPASFSLLICYFLIGITHFFYYPKWDQAYTEATISYDVSGYYLYLPAIFIYQDLKEVKFLDEVMVTYRPSGHAYQVFPHESGNKVMKYSAGQAVVYLPAFAAGHLWATLDSAYPADGFSKPYQFAVSMQSLLISFLGLYWLMLILRSYFREKVVALTLFLIAIGTNYFNYSAIDGAMTHNTVFTLYALLLLATDRFYRRPSHLWASVIGVCIGLAALTRPTEIIAVLIPLLWNVAPDKTDRGGSLLGLARDWPKVVIAVVLTASIGFMQLAYWKYVCGSWLVYSYQDQNFDWFTPHLYEGFFSYKAGWLVYTPLLGFALLGLPLLYRYCRKLLPALAVHSLLFIYVTFSWSVWWYGGSLGQRAMVQAYPILAFPLAALLTWLFVRKRQKVIVMFSLLVVGQLLALSVWHNLWFTHQAHRGKLFYAEQMTEAYFWRVLYEFSPEPEDFLRLDTPEFFTKLPSSKTSLLREDFAGRYDSSCPGKEGVLCLLEQDQISQKFEAAINLSPGTWIRATVDARIARKRGNKDNYSQMVIIFNRKGKEVKRQLIRMHRVLNLDFEQSISIDSRVPKEGADQVVVVFWNGGNSQPLLELDNLTIDALYE